MNHDNDIEEIRLVADLSVMHTKINELHSIVDFLRERHAESAIVTCADYDVLAEDIHKSNEVYLWLVRLKEEKHSVSLGE